MQRRAATTPLAVLLAPALLFAGCSSTSDQAASSGPKTYYADIKPILDAHCATCHVEGGVGPFPLTTYEGARDNAPLVQYQVSERTMPPWLAEPGIRSYRYDPSLTQAQIDAIASWVAGGTPAGDPAHEGAPLDVETSQLPRVDLTMEMPESYTPTRLPDEYRCFIMDWPYDHQVYVTGFDARPGNLAIVHHLQAYLATPTDAATVEGYDASDPAPGYSCYGGPSLDGAPQLQSRFLGGWTPGRGGLLLPGGTGIAVDPGSKVILQVHYHAHTAVAAPDQSSLLMTVEEQVSGVGLYVPWTNSQWPIQPASMLIPAGAPETTHSYNATVSSSLVFNVFSGGMKFPNGLYVHSAYAHAHKLAREIEMGVARTDGSAESMLTIPKWNFDWQREYVFADSLYVAPDDQLTISCTWSNTAADQPIVDGAQQAPHDVTWGEGTGDEMCTSILYVTEQP